MNGLNCVTDTSEAIRPTSFFLFLFFFFFSVHHKHSLTCSPRRRFSAGSLLLQTEIGPASAPIPKKKNKKKTCIEKKEEEEKNKKTSAILRRFCRIRADILLSDSLCSRSHSDVVCNPHISLGDMPFTLTVMMIMHPIFPPFPFFFSRLLRTRRAQRHPQVPLLKLLSRCKAMPNRGPRFIYLFIFLVFSSPNDEFRRGGGAQDRFGFLPDLKRVFLEPGVTSPRRVERSETSCGQFPGGSILKSPSLTLCDTPPAVP